MDPKGPTPHSVLGAYPLAYKGGAGTSLSPKGRLVALGSAAVLTVYCVGYIHTIPAAQRAEIVSQVAKQLPGAPLKWKDGTYLGWGSCRHGDLQASVVILHGRIIFASISQCFTRYSKKVIAQLPGQVVARQSADVDQVSRATESSDAFYQAVTDALLKAK